MADQAKLNVTDTFALCLGATGPLFAGYMLNGGYSWRLFFYVEIAFGVALLIFAFFVVEETTYHRKLTQDSSDGPEDAEKPEASAVERSVTARSNLPQRKTYLQTLKFWGVWERDSEFFLMMARSFTYFLVPHVFWVVTTYGEFPHPWAWSRRRCFQEVEADHRPATGINIGIGALTFNYIMPIKVTAPPYNWSQLNSGLVSVGTIIGYCAALPFTTSSDRLAAHLTKKNNMVREAEMRLGVCLPAMLIAPAGLIVFGFTAERNLHWVGYFAGVIMSSWSSYFYFTFVLSYALDSYTANTSEMLIAMNLGKQAISFGMGLNLLEWVQEHGYAVMISGVFCGVLLANQLALIPFMLYGKSIRAYMARTWLARIHKDSVREVMTA